MTINSVWHAGFTVSDIERSIAFYTEAVGLELRHRQEQENEYTSTFIGYPEAKLRVAQFALPGGQPGRSGHVLELCEYVRPRGETIAPGTSATGSGHIAFETDALDETVARMVAAGGTPVSEPVAIVAGVNRGGRTVYVRDPDGITVELVQAPPSAEAAA
jgi:catechol 2,3-dioxygenase-like lactoylglutathione lyase family enzyme